MIAAIDFGCHEIRSAFRDEQSPGKLTLMSELSHYAVLPKQDNFLANLQHNRIPYANCENSFVVFGNHADHVRWLSRKPLAQLFLDGEVPRHDAPARQILSVLTKAMLPAPTGQAICCLSSPSAGETEAFLARLVRMCGWNPITCSAGHAVLLATGLESRFTGITIVMGAESTDVCLHRFGREVASRKLNVGARWIDCELATTFSLKTWDPEGDAYLDFAEVRKWKHHSRRHLQRITTDRERTLSRLYGAVLTRIARCVRDFILSDNPINSQRLPIVCAGGATEIAGFASLLTERLVEHEIASKLTTVRVAPEATTAVTRGLLISAELEEQVNISKAA